MASRRNPLLPEHNVVAVKCKPLIIWEKQAKFRRLKTFVKGFCAGRGTGKTKIGVIDVLMSASDGEPWMAISPTYVVLNDTTWPTFKETAKELGVWLRGVKSPVPRAWFRTQDGGIAEIVFRSGDKPEHLRGASNAGLWIDEASICHHDVFKWGIATLRYKGRMGQCRLTFTPKGKRHWTFGIFYERLQESDGGRFIETDGEVLYERLNRETGNLQQFSVADFGGTPYLLKPDAGLVQAHTSENPFVPTEFFDNIRGHYTSALAAQELGGEFVELEGLMFRREWYVGRIVDEVPRIASRVRYWDRAATEGDGCFTAGVLVAMTPDGRFYIEDVVRGQWSAHSRDVVIRETAVHDAARYNNEVVIYAEQEGGSGGKEVAEQMIIKLAGFPVYKDVVSGQRTKIKDNIVVAGRAKIVRAQPHAAQAEAGNVYLKRAKWNDDWLEEITAFPEYAFSDQCVVAGTLVTTDRGQVPIEHVDRTDLVATRDGWKRVLDCGMTNPCDDTFGVHFDCGTMLKATHQHPIWVEVRGFVPLSQLSPGDDCLWLTSSKEILIEKRLCLTGLSFIDIQTQKGDTLASITGDTIESKYCPSIRRFGYSITDAFRKDVSSITKMGIHSTMRFQTSRVLPAESITGNMLGAATFQLQKPLRISTGFATSHQSGMEARKAGSGILNTQSHSEELVSRSVVKSVERNTKPRMSARIDFVPQDVLKMLGPQGQKSTEEHVNGARKNSNLTSEIGDFVLSHARIRSITPAGKRPVYNLRVEGLPEFFANGILVHNCDATSGAFNKLARRGPMDGGQITRTHMDGTEDTSRFGVNLIRSRAQRARFQGNGQ